MTQHWSAAEIDRLYDQWDKLRKAGRCSLAEWLMLKTGMDAEPAVKLALEADERAAERIWREQNKPTGS